MKKLFLILFLITSIPAFAQDQSSEKILIQTFLEDDHSQDNSSLHVSPVLFNKYLQCPEMPQKFF